ncbi:hypothetical protein HID58_095598 [Brassica napus]|uniref:Terpene synthase metal-binding domain-containing protein n=1 Tax=Brassica napus TaxID=3708 RepID=A0ABQ7X4M4_BRANA|nr:hypothetical protein HID58_095598 [Brassica napus]
MHTERRKVIARDFLKEKVRKMLDVETKSRLEQLDSHRRIAKTRDIFDVIIDKIESETFKSDDINSIISLYEASYLSTKSDIKLRNSCSRNAVPLENEKARTEVYIDAYEKKHDTNLVLIEFCQNRFHIYVQIAHQEDLKYAFQLVEGDCLVNHLPLIVENYFVAVGIIYEPQFGNSRRIISIVNALVTTIDDIYDIMALLKNLKSSTAMVE